MKYNLKIPNFIQIKEQTSRNHGLSNGNIGLCLYCYQLSKTSGNAEYEGYADELLDKVFDSLSNSTTPNFSNGIAGIGWGIEYLVQNGFAEGDTDEILEEVDNRIFKTLNEKTITIFELANGLTGYLYYLNSRLKKPMDVNTMAQQINRELLIKTINRLDEIVTVQFPLIVKDTKFDLFWRFTVLIYGLYEAFNLNVYNEKIKCMIKQWLPNIEAYIPSMHINKIYWALVLSLIYELVPEKRLAKQIQVLLFSTDFDELLTEVDYSAVNVRFGPTGFVWILKQATKIISNTCPNYSCIELMANKIISKNSAVLGKFLKESESNIELRIGLFDGIAGIGLMEILYPETFICTELKKELQNG